MCTQLIANKLEQSLQVSRQNAAKSTSRVSTDSQVNYRFLSPLEMDTRLHNLHALQRQTKLKMDRMAAKISLITEVEGIEVDTVILFK